MVIGVSQSMALHNYITELVVLEMRKVGKDVDCVSITGNPKAAASVTKTMRVVLNFYGDDQFQECLEYEGIDALSHILRMRQKRYDRKFKCKWVEEKKTDTQWIPACSVLNKSHRLWLLF